MIARLRKLGFLDGDEYGNIKDFIASLPHLHRRRDLLFVLDINVFNFLLQGWARDPESAFDFTLSSRVYDDIIEKLGANTRATVSSRQTAVWT